MERNKHNLHSKQFLNQDFLGYKLLHSRVSILWLFISIFTPLELYQKLSISNDLFVNMDFCWSGELVSSFVVSGSVPVAILYKEVALPVNV